MFLVCGFDSHPGYDNWITCTRKNRAMYLIILICCTLWLVQVVYNIAGANGGNYPVPPPEIKYN